MPAGLESADGVEGGMVGGVAGGVVGGVPGGVLSVAPPPKLAPPPPPPKPKPKAPLFVVSNLQQSKLINMVKPAYPQSAKEARVQGSVVMSIVIDENGDVKQVNVVSGPPTLTDAAVNAVKQWKYAPTILNGKAIEVTTTVTVTFNLQS
jgi:protein TonB